MAASSSSAHLRRRNIADVGASGNPPRQFVERELLFLEDVLKEWMIYVSLILMFIFACFYVSDPLSFIKLTSSSISGEARFTEFCYFMVVTISTVGYGDYTPESTAGKISVAIIVLLSSFVFVCFISSFMGWLEKVESYLTQKAPVSWVNKRDFKTFRVKVKVLFSLSVIVVWIGVGFVLIRSLEEHNGLSGSDAFYFSVISMTTVGFGDLSFKSEVGQMCATIWLLMGCSQVGISFSYLGQVSFNRMRKVKLNRALNENLQNFTLSEINFYQYMLLESRLTSQDEWDAMRQGYNRYLDSYHSEP